jgi:hypothetical protein
MHTSSLLEEHADALLNSARAFQFAAAEAGGSEAAPVALARLEETLRILSAGCQRLAGDAATPPLSESFTPSRRRLVGVLQDVSAALVRCSRVCRDAEYVMAHLSPPASAGAGGPEPVLSPAKPS